MSWRTLSHSNYRLLENTISITGIQPKELDEVMRSHLAWRKDMIQVQSTGERDPFSVTSFLLELGGTVLIELVVELVKRVFKRYQTQRIRIVSKAGVEIIIQRSQGDSALLQELLEPFLQDNAVSTIEIYK